MILEKHIVNRLLLDDNFWYEIVTSHAESDGVDLKKEDADVDKYVGLYRILNNDGNKNYYVTGSVIDKLHLFDTKRCMSIEGWKVFETLPDFKKTFILPDVKEYKYGGNRCIRVEKKNGMLAFIHFDFEFYKSDQRTKHEDGNLKWVIVWADLQGNRLSEHMHSEDGVRLAPFLYALMCYVELCDNEIKIVQPKEKYGTKKLGKIINTLPFPITIINNTWNVVTVTGEFWVSGHSALFWVGKGHQLPRVLYIAPYQKTGYTRRSGKELSGEASGVK